MSSPWERLFIVAARLFGWVVAMLPIAALLIFVLTIVMARQHLELIHTVPALLRQLGVAVLIAFGGTLIGTTLGIGAALFSHEIVPSKTALLRGPIKFLSSVPPVVLGWIVAITLVPQTMHRSWSWIVASAVAAVSVALIPRGYIVAVRSMRALPLRLREAAAALGASNLRIASQVLLPGAARMLGGAYADGFARTIGEAVAVSLIFLVAIRAGSASPMSLGAALLAQARSLHGLDASLALSALVLLLVCGAVHQIATLLIGKLEWV